MAEIADRLMLAQWLSPAFPVGGFAYSQGLEVAMEEGAVAHAVDVEAWVCDGMMYGSAWNDAVFLAHARAGHDMGSLAALYRAYATSAERLAEAEDQGRAFAMTVSAMSEPVLPQPFPLAFGAASRRLCLSTTEVLAFWLQAWAGQLILAAVRFIPIGAAEGQAILSRLAPTLSRLAEAVAEAPLSALGGAAFGADLATMRHETLSVRIFRS